jgi:hypothetical protein
MKPGTLHNIALLRAILPLVEEVAGTTSTIRWIWV